MLLQLPTRAALVALFLPLSTLAFPLPDLADLARRADDDTGCNMNAGSALMQCLGDWASVPPVPAATASGNGIASEALSLCEQYTQIANCWGNGTYCREWLPVKTAADKLCAIASLASEPSSAAPTSTSASATLSASASANSTIPLSTSLQSSLVSTNSTSSPTLTLLVTASATFTSSSAVEATTTIPLETFSSVAAEASQVITSIWNNDSGTDIPSISNDIEPTKTNPTWTIETSTATVTAGESDPSTTGSQVAAQSGGGNGAGAVSASCGLVLLAFMPSLFLLA
ncbi:hypothetical protein JCM10207_001193 [Rhodosporidiobolus poonsookiae]